MKSIRKQRRIQLIIVASLALAAMTALVGYAMQDGINLYRSPTQVVETPPNSREVFRIGGLVEEGSLTRDQGELVRFRVTDTNKTVPVEYTGILPDLFEEGQSMIGKGRLIDGTFVATEILAKHDESYIPKEVIDTLKEQGVYKPADGAVSNN
ncbi:MAG: cytochrome c maturation protein CcmE [Paracoccaceae bacterium]|nr:cytochrome C-type biogenesis protein, CcmE [Rhodobacteraceae bacterium HTCC2150]MDG1531733.1 cytochrome c maturation protein CcmE [Paracoccaceae bacterium]